MNDGLTISTTQLLIKSNDWEPIGPRGAERLRLLATITINGGNFHCDAIAVDKNNVAKCAEYQRIIDALSHADDDGLFQTQRIGRHQYVVFATPFQQ